MAKAGPDKDRWQVHCGEGCCNDQDRRQAFRGRIDRDRREGHEPAFRVDPLEPGRLQECEGFACRFALGRRGGIGDFPREEQEVSDAEHFHDGVQQRIGFEHLDQAQPDHHDHEPMAQRDAQHMGHCAANAEVCTRRHQHQVVWAGCDRGRDGKADKGEEKFHSHRATIVCLKCNLSLFVLKVDIVSQLYTNMDEISERILRVLEADGRISNIELADRVGLSASACLRRVQELERSGVIQGYRAVLNRTALKRDFVAYVAVGLSGHTKAVQADFEKAVAAMSEVLECHNITGTVEYLLRVEVADLVAYKAFHMDRLGTLGMVNTLTTYVVMGSPKDARG